MKLDLTVNGTPSSADIEPRMLLVHHLRESLGLTGTKVGCDTSTCGACTVLVDGESVKSCTVFAAQVAGSEVTTIEGLAGEGELTAMQRGLPPAPRPAVRLLHLRDGGGRDLPAQGEPQPHRVAEVRYGLEGNLCRCTGYHNIVKAVLAAAGGDKR